MISTVRRSAVLLVIFLSLASCGESDDGDALRSSKSDWDFGSDNSNDQDELAVDDDEQEIIACSAKYGDLLDLLIEPLEAFESGLSVADLEISLSAVATEVDGLPQDLEALWCEAEIGEPLLEASKLLFDSLQSWEGCLEGSIEQMPGTSCSEFEAPIDTLSDFGSITDILLGTQEVFDARTAAS